MTEGLRGAAAWQVLSENRTLDPLRGTACRQHAVRRARGGAGAAGAALATGQGRPGLRRTGLRRAGYRQIAPRPGSAGAPRGRAAHSPALVLLAAPPGQRALSDRRPARTGGRVSPRRHGRATAGQAGGAARARHQRSRRTRGADRRTAVDPDRGALSAARSHATKPQGEDAAGAAGAGRGTGGRQPVLMLSEDAHWSDPTSLELLDLIVDRAPALPLLLIVTYRHRPIRRSRRPGPAARMSA